MPRSRTNVRTLMTALRAGHRRRSEEWIRRIEGPVHRYERLPG